MFSDLKYFDAYKIIIPTNFNITEYTPFATQNDEYLNKLKTTWKFYSIFINIAISIKGYKLLLASKPARLKLTILNVFV